LNPVKDNINSLEQRINTLANQINFIDYPPVSSQASEKASESSVYPDTTEVSETITTLESVTTPTASKSFFLKKLKKILSKTFITVAAHKEALQTLYNEIHQCPCSLLSSQESFVIELIALISGFLSLLSFGINIYTLYSKHSARSITTSSSTSSSPPENPDYRPSAPLQPSTSTAHPATPETFPLMDISESDSLVKSGSNTRIVASVSLQKNVATRITLPKKHATHQ
jgi:hypothetical protein